MSTVFAGSDTTSTLITMLGFILVTRPDIVHRLRAELHAELGPDPDLPSLSFDQLLKLPFLNATLNETLRLFPSAAEIGRHVTCDVELGGGLVPKGKTVLLALYSLHRNEAFWPRATEFLPERWLPEGRSALGPRHPDAFLAWGTGSRSCIGRHQAMAEASIVALSLLARCDLVPGGGAGVQAEPVLTSELGLKLEGGLKIRARARM